MDKEALKRFVEESIATDGAFLVKLTVSADNDIAVEIDADCGVDIDYCAALSRKIEQEFDRDAEDYSLEIGTPSLTDPFLTLRQYQKHLGDEVEVLADGKKYRGTLQQADPDQFTILCQEKVKPEGAKRPTVQEVERSFPYDKVTYTKYLLQF